MPGGYIRPELQRDGGAKKQKQPESVSRLWQCRPGPYQGYLRVVPGGTPDRGLSNPQKLLKVDECLACVRLTVSAGRSGERRDGPGGLRTVVVMIGEEVQALIAAEYIILLGTIRMHS